MTSEGERSDEGFGGIAPNESRASRHNRPGLLSVKYRLDTHAGFPNRMLANLHKETHLERADGSKERKRPLRSLTTRSIDDPAIAILDAWAMVGDVLTFYQERIANEGFLRTLTERRSVLELARAVGYELKPGAAANVHLVFTVEDVPSGPRIAEIPAGTQVQNIPDPDKMIQTFETVEAFQARVEWNALFPYFKKEPQKVGGKATEVLLEGMDNQLQPGDPLLFIGENRKWNMRFLETVTTNSESNTTLLTWNEPLSTFDNSESGPFVNPEVFAMRERPYMVAKMENDEPKLYTFSNDIKEVGKPKDNIDLEGTYPRILQGSFVALTCDKGLYKVESVSLMTKERIEKIPQSDTGDTGTKEKDPLEFKYRVKVTNLKLDPIDAFPEQSSNFLESAIFAQSELLTLAKVPVKGLLEGKTIELDRAVYGMVAGKTLIVIGKRMRAQIKTNKLTLESAEGTQKDLKSGEMALVLKMPLPQERSAESQDRTAECEWTLMDGDGFAGSADAPSSSILLMPAWEEDEFISEAVTLQEITQSEGRTVLTFKDCMVNCYDPGTVSVHANVVLATHGETVEEVLGSGDGSLRNQRFELQNPYLTYVSAPTPSGVKNTLEIRVDGILWKEVSSLYGLDERSESYTVQIDDDGVSTVIFGDGKSGTRLPSGEENVTAVYRKGIGPDGEVPAGSLTLLPDQPPGIEDVVNPIPSSGAAPPERLSDARRNVPMRALTLDRIVSLRDFENFARSFAGIGKAQAVSISMGRGNVVHITIASSSGSKIDRESELFKNLIKAIDVLRDPVERVKQRIFVDNFKLQTFSLKAGVLVDPRYIAEEVLALAKTELKKEFCFENRDFGQPVTSSEVISIIQSVEGVIAVDLDKLERDGVDGEKASLGEILESKEAYFNPKPDWEGEKIIPAELLLLNPTEKGADLKELKP